MSDEEPKRFPTTPTIDSLTFEAAMGSCPHLGASHDPLTRYAYPINLNRCYQQSASVEVDIGQQRGFCLSANHVKCPRLVSTQPQPASQPISSSQNTSSPASIDRSMAPRDPAQSNVFPGPSRRPILLGLAGVAAGLLLLAGLYVGLRAVSGNEGAAEPTISSSPAAVAATSGPTAPTTPAAAAAKPSSPQLAAAASPSTMPRTATAAPALSTAPTSGPTARSVVAPPSATTTRPTAVASTPAAPIATATVARPTVPATPAPPTATLRVTPFPSTVHLVQPGEGLYGIAIAYGVTVEEIMKANNLTDRGTINSGQRLTIPDPRRLPQAP